MMLAKDFMLNDVEYIVCDATKGYAPRAAGIELLAHRRYGIGADRVMVFTGTSEEPSFLLYAADGRELVPEKADYLVLAAYLGSEGIQPNVAEMVHALGDQALVAKSSLAPSFELHVTESFCKKLRALDRRAESLAS